MDRIEKVENYYLEAFYSEWAYGVTRTPRYRDTEDMLLFPSLKAIDTFNMSLHLGKPMVNVEVGMQMPESNIEEFNDDKVWSIV
jgi:hypothetical protein